MNSEMENVVSVISAIVFEKDTFCPEKVEEMKNAPKEEGVAFVRKKIVILEQIIKERKIIGGKIWENIGCSREDMEKYFESLDRVVMCHPAAEELYRAKYEAFYKILPPHER